MTSHLPSPAAGRSGRHPSLRRFGALGAVVLAIAACGGGAVLSGTGASVADGTRMAQPAATAGPAMPGDAVLGSGEAQGPAPAPAASVSDIVNGPLIVRTGQLALQVTALDDALAAAGKVVTAAGGYVASSQRQGDGDTAGATVTFRIPAERWDTTLAALRAVGTKVLSEQTASEEVTSQVVDLGARLVNLAATETALQAIMAKATKIPDILEVQSQLTTVRQEIEQLTAQKQTLEKQAALGTLAVAFNLPPVVAVTQVQKGWDPAAEVDRAAATLVGLGQGVASAAIWAAIVLLPLAVVLAVVLGVAWLVVRRARPRRTPSAPSAPSAPTAPLDAAAS